MNWLALALMVSLGTPAAVHREALTYLNAGRYGDAENLSRQAVAGFGAVYGTDNLEVALVLKDLAEAYRREGDLAQAEKASRRSLEIIEKKLGTEDANAALGRDQLGEIYFEAHRYQDAD
ncbi:MAG TPA: tetratricopeptide repeat protein [Bryobacteraceae bacterium]|nr:tetratricopeptide repeat protein [Bryobacteraceae bacterium]